MSKPWVFYPAGNPQEGANHRTVTIRHNRSSLSIKCSTRAIADELGKALVGVFNKHLASNPKMVRTHTCLRCGHEWDAEVVLVTGPTSNLSGELTPWCPGCGTKEVSSTPWFEKVV